MEGGQHLHNSVQNQWVLIVGLEAQAFVEELGGLCHWAAAFAGSVGQEVDVNDASTLVVEDL